jgi:hypothetical protein
MESESTLPKASFSGSDDPAYFYKPVSSMAVLTLCLGIASLGAYFTGLFWIVPPIALVVGIVASRWLETAKSEYAGQFIAKLGLVLATVSLVGPPTIFFTKRFIMVRESRGIAERYLDLLLQYKIKTAFALTVNPSVQVAQKDNVEKILDRVGREAYMGWLESGVCRILGGMGARAQVTYNGSIYPGVDQGVERVMHQYMVTIDPPSPNEKPIIWSVPVHVRGARAPGGEWEGRRWQIEMCSPEAYDPDAEKNKSMKRG